MTDTANLNIEHLASNLTSPETEINRIADELDAAIAGRLVHNMASDADYTLDSHAADDELPEWGYPFIEITDTAPVLTAARSIIFPAETGPTCLFKNSTAQTLTAKVSGQAGVAVSAGAKVLLYYNGTDMALMPVAVAALVGQVAVANGGTGSSTASGARTNLGLGTVATEDVGSDPAEIPRNLILGTAAYVDWLQIIEAHVAASHTEPTLLNSWTNFGGGYEDAGYYRRGGRVYLRGMIDGGTVGSAAFTLPEGYRPTNNVTLATISNNAIGRIAVTTAGEVRPVTPSVTTWVSLDGLSFPIAE